jgi:hypothetical protein
VQQQAALLLEARLVERVGQHGKDLAHQRQVVRLVLGFGGFWVLVGFGFWWVLGFGLVVGFGCWVLGFFGGFFCVGLVCGLVD